MRIDEDLKNTVLEVIKNSLKPNKDRYIIMIGDKQFIPSGRGEYKHKSGAKGAITNKINSLVHVGKRISSNKYYDQYYVNKVKKNTPDDYELYEIIGTKYEEMLAATSQKEVNQIGKNLTEILIQEGIIEIKKL